MAPGKRGSLTTRIDHVERAQGSHGGNCKGRGSAGGPETRMKRNRGTQLVQRMGRQGCVVGTLRWDPAK